MECSGRGSSRGRGLAEKSRTCTVPTTHYLQATVSLVSTHHTAVARMLSPSPSMASMMFAVVRTVLTALSGESRAYQQ